MNEKLSLTKRIISLYLKLGVLSEFELCNTPILIVANNSTRKQLRADYKHLKTLKEANKMKNSYTANQKKSGLKVGDKVRITRKADDYEQGWNNTWVDGMDGYIGKVVTINIFWDDSAGIGIDDSIFYSFPYFIMEKVENENI